MKRLVGALAFCCLPLTACCAPAPEPTSSGQAIVHGVRTNQHAAVGQLIVRLSNGFAFGSNAVLVGPNSILTVASNTNYLSAKLKGSGSLSIIPVPLTNLASLYPIVGIAFYVDKPDCWGPAMGGELDPESGRLVYQVVETLSFVNPATVQAAVNDVLRTGDTAAIEAASKDFAAVMRLDSYVSIDVAAPMRIHRLYPKDSLPKDGQRLVSVFSYGLSSTARMDEVVERSIWAKTRKMTNDRPIRWIDVMSGSLTVFDPARGDSGAVAILDDAGEVVALSEGTIDSRKRAWVDVIGLREKIEGTATGWATLP